MSCSTKKDERERESKNEGCKVTEIRALVDSQIKSLIHCNTLFFLFWDFLFVFIQT